MNCPLCGYFLSSLDTECPRCHGQGLKQPGATPPASASQNPAHTIAGQQTVPRFISQPASSSGSSSPPLSPSHLNPKANPALHDDPVLAALNKRGRGPVLEEGGFSFNIWWAALLGVCLLFYLFIRLFSSPSRPVSAPPFDTAPSTSQTAGSSSDVTAPSPVAAPAPTESSEQIKADLEDSVQSSLNEKLQERGLSSRVTAVYLVRESSDSSRYTGYAELSDGDKVGVIVTRDSDGDAIYKTY